MLPTQDVLITADVKQGADAMDHPEKGILELDPLSFIYMKLAVEIRYEDVIAGKPTPHLTGPIEYEFNLIPKKKGEALHWEPR